MLTDGWNLNVDRVLLAHEYLSRPTQRCDYLGRRGSYGLVYAIEGEGEYRFSSGEKCLLSAGEAILLSADSSYVMTAKTPFRHYTVNFTLREGNAPTSLLKSGFVRTPVQGEGFRRHLAALVAARRRKGVGYEMESVGRLYLSLSIFAAALMGEKTRGGVGHALLPARRRIEDDPFSPISLEELAALCHMSVTGFRRRWLSAFGETAMRYRDQLRLSHSEELLLTGYYTVSEVASRCGFEDVSYFVKFFKRHRGVTPKDFIKNADFSVSNH